MLFTYFILFLANVYCEHPAHIRQNKINNDCDFDIIRIKKKDVTCYDFGSNKKYCKYFALPYEFIVKKEKSLIENNIIIKPEALYEEFTNNKFLMAKFYYSFVCDKYILEPRLELNIVPVKEYDLSLVDELYQALTIICLLIIFIMTISFICPCLENNYNDGLIN